MFEPRRRRLLEARRTRQQQIDEGDMPDFPAETAQIRRSHWKVAATPADLMDRRVEITGPTDRKMVINALNSGRQRLHGGLRGFQLAHLAEPARRPGQLARRRQRDHHVRPVPRENTTNLCEKPAVLMVRPARVAPGGETFSDRRRARFRPRSSISACSSFTTPATLILNGTAPYFYLPKMESRFEARLWNDVFLAAQDDLGISRGTIRATVLIETILAAFEMDEILWELREHSAGLNCGRWDYIFSLHQEVPESSRVCAAGPRQGHHDQPFPAESMWNC